LVESAAFALSHLSLTRTHAYTGAAPASGGPFPVLIFSHGWTGLREQNTFQVEDLVSQGYVVMAADHTYAAAYTVFPDGSVAYSRPDALPEGAPSDVYDKAARLLGDTFVADLRYLMDQAARLNSGEIASSLQGRFDLDRMGVFGHSTGGGAAVAVCAADPRCKAGLSMDAWLIPYDPDIARQGLSQPFFFMQSQSWSAKGNLPLATDLFQNMKGPAYRLIISGTGHYDFSDLPLLTPLANAIGLKGPTPSEKVDQIIKTYTLTFFDQVFKKRYSTLLQPGGSPFPEVMFTAKLGQ
jgi:predicted dienelactone hydrolase